MRFLERNNQSLEDIKSEVSRKMRAVELSLTEKVEALQHNLLAEIRQLSANTQSIESLQQGFETQTMTLAQISSSQENVMQAIREISNRENTLEKTLLGRIQELQQALLTEIQQDVIEARTQIAKPLQQEVKTQAATLAQISSSLDSVLRSIMDLPGRENTLGNALLGKIQGLQQALIAEIQQNILEARTQITEPLQQGFKTQSVTLAQISSSLEPVLPTSLELSSRESTLEKVLLGRMQELQQALISEVQGQHIVLNISHISTSLEKLQEKLEKHDTTIKHLPSVSEAVQRLLVQVEKLHTSLAQRLPTLPSDGRSSLDTLRQAREQRMLIAANAISEYQKSDVEWQQATEEDKQRAEQIYGTLMQALVSIAPSPVPQRLEAHAIDQGNVVEISEINVHTDTGQ